MKDSGFLMKLKEEGKLKLVDESEDISKSYLIKSEKCMKVAKLAYEANIFENSISEAYYSMYNCVLALFFKCGIKCENHSGSVILIKRLFKLDELHVFFSKIKKERIDNQYYVPVIDSEPIKKNQCKNLLDLVSDFNIEIKVYIQNLTNEKIKEIRDKFENL